MKKSILPLLPPSSHPLPTPQPSSHQTPATPPSLRHSHTIIIITIDHLHTAPPPYLISSTLCRHPFPRHCHVESLYSWATSIICHFLHATHSCQPPPSLLHKSPTCARPPPMHNLHLRGSMGATPFHHHNVVMHIHHCALLCHNGITFSHAYLAAQNLWFYWIKWGWKKYIQRKNEIVFPLYIFFSPPLNPIELQFCWGYFFFITNESWFRCDKNKYP